MSFIQPILVGNLVLCKAELTYVGRTSMEVRVDVVAENPLKGTSLVTNNAYLVYVALDTNGLPTPVPALALETALELSRADEARQRQEYRKQQRLHETR
jgi:acyl-CoA hydrolase